MEIENVQIVLEIKSHQLVDIQVLPENSFGVISVQVYHNGTTKV